jgi:hypothetical protein
MIHNEPFKLAYSQKSPLLYRNQSKEKAPLRIIHIFFFALSVSSIFIKSKLMIKGNELKKLKPNFARE